MEEAKTLRLIDRWICDYFCQLSWKEFQKEGRVESIWIHDFVRAKEGTSEPGSKESQDKKTRLLVDLMYYLSFGDRLRNDDDEKVQTGLEKAVGIFAQLLDKTDVGTQLDLTAIQDLRCLLKQQAVLVCCRQSKFSLAKEVFKRQWVEWKNQRELETMEKLRAVLAKKDKSHGYIDSNPYSLLLKSSVTVLRKVFQSIKIPFLVNIGGQLQNQLRPGFQNRPLALNIGIGEAIRISLVEDNEPGMESKSKSDAAATAADVRSALDEVDMNIKTNDHRPDPKVALTEVDKAGNSVKNGFPQKSPSGVTKEQNQQMQQSERGTISKEPVACCSKDLPPEIEEDTSESDIELLRESERICKEAGYDSDTEELSESECIAYRSKDSQSKKRRAKEAESGLLDWDSDLEVKEQHNKRRRWSPKEEERIYLGVQKYGFGQWRRISNFLKTNRSNVDVKDKWRTMNNQGKIQMYEDRFGPLLK